MFKVFLFHYIMQNRINRSNKDPKSQKGLTPLSLLDKKILREQRQKETQERLKTEYGTTSKK